MNKRYKVDTFTLLFKEKVSDIVFVCINVDINEFL